MCKVCTVEPLYSSHHWGIAFIEEWPHLSGVLYVYKSTYLGLRRCPYKWSGLLLVVTLIRGSILSQGLLVRTCS